MSVPDQNLADWVWSPSPMWPVAQGSVGIDGAGAVTVTLDAEGAERWRQLRAHLGNDPLVPALER